MYTKFQKLQRVFIFFINEERSLLDIYKVNNILSVII